MNCVAECEYCRSVNVCIDSPNCNTTGHFCTKLNRLVSINKPVDEEFSSVALNIGMNDERFKKIIIEYSRLPVSKKELLCEFFEKFIF